MCVCVEACRICRHACKHARVCVCAARPDDTPACVQAWHYARALGMRAGLCARVCAARPSRKRVCVRACVRACLCAGRPAQMLRRRKRMRKTFMTGSSDRVSAVTILRSDFTWNTAW